MGSVPIVMTPTLRLEDCDGCRPLAGNSQGLVRFVAAGEVRAAGRESPAMRSNDEGTTTTPRPTRTPVEPLSITTSLGRNEAISLNG